MATAKELGTSKERVLFGIAAAVSAVVWIILCVSVVALVYSLLVAVGVLMAHALLLAHVTGNGVRVSPTQLPEIWQKVQEAARKLGMATAARGVRRVSRRRPERLRDQAAQPALRDRLLGPR